MSRLARAVFKRAVLVVVVVVVVLLLLSGYCGTRVEGFRIKQ